MLKRTRVTFVMLLTLALLAGLWSARTSLLKAFFEDTLDPQTGDLVLPGLSAPVQVRRDALGIPRIEASNLEDLSRAAGWVMASDRFEQMVSFVLLAQGRLSEMAGPVALNLDVYMRTLGVREMARRQCEALSPDLRHLLSLFAEGVNTWMDQHQGRMPFGIALADYQPEPWKGENACDIFALVNLGLGVNLQEELAFLNVAARVGAEKAAWLFPVYPDEPLDFDEAAKLAGEDLTRLAADTRALQDLARQLEQMGVARGLAASNNWAIAPDRTQGGASILANDTHLLLEHPPLWMLMQLSSPDYTAGGIALAGIPGIVAGSNGDVAWGMTMVMADSQDLFLEKLRQRNGRWEALYKDEWEPVSEREEVFYVKGRAEPFKRLIRTTRHGPLLNEAVAGERVNKLLPVPTVSRYGLAVQQTSAWPDRSMDALLRLGRARTAAEAQQIVQGIEFIHLNLVFADREHIGWQVTG
ncbi:MAG: penicillin acylase family protein, partial [Gammaproteobacteria bacterium]